MADTPKRRKLEKSSDAASPSQARSSNVYCCRCGRAYNQRKGSFPVSHSPMYRGTGYLPWCNQCIDEMYEGYRSDLGDEKAAVQRMCMKLDVYWSESIYKMTEYSAGNKSRIKAYIGKTNIIRYLDKTYDDTLAEAAKEVTELKARKLNEEAGDTADSEEVTIDPKTIEFWGAGYKPDFYDELDSRYKEWTGGKEVKDPSERSLYRQICLLETLIRRDAADGKQVKDNVNALNTLIGSMNLKPAQRKEDADTELENMPLGVGIEKWENNRPLPPTPKDRIDVRKNIENITTWFLGHACKMVGLRNSYTRMYEEKMDELRVKRPELEDEDDDTVLSDIFGGKKSGGDE